MSMWQHLKAIPPLFRGELMIGSAALYAQVHRWDGRPMPDRDEEPEEWAWQLRRLPTDFPDGLADHYTVDGDGRPTGILICRKKITGEFVTNLVANMCGTATDIAQYKFHDCGTNNTAEANTDSALGTEISSPTTRATGTQVAGGTATAPTYQTVATTGPHPAASVVEHIIATTAARTTTDILDRSVFTAIAIGLNDFITWTHTSTFNAES